MPFAINPASGLLTVGAALDFETSNPGGIDVSITCADPPGASSTATYTIVVTDVPEMPAFTQACPVSMTFGEDLTANALLGSPVSAADQDRGTVLVYSIRAVTPAAAAPRFKLDTLTGQLSLIGRFDSEGMPPDSTFTVVVGVTDLIFSVNCTIGITVTDVDE